MLEWLRTPKKKKKKFGYDAVEDTGRRRTRSVSLRHEDDELSVHNRRKLISNTRDLHRNYGVAAWAKRKHLDYVTTFNFQSRTGNTELDHRIEELVEWWSRPFNFDVAGRHSLSRFIRLCEDRAVTDGDVFVFKLSDGHVQGIEGDRVQTPQHDLPNNFKAEEWTHGVKTTASGRDISYCVCDRAVGRTGFCFKTIIPAKHAYTHGYFDRFDQVRGVSPVAAALNTWADIYEAGEYALAKAKVSQLFGVKFTRASDESLDGATDSEQTSDYRLDFSSGPAVIDLDPGDDAQFMESHTPSTEFASYMQLMTAAALKSLDIPFSFFDESHTNYSGARQALLQYEQSASIRRHEVRRLLDQLTIWRLGLFVDDGVLELPADITLIDLKWDWVGVGLPWIDPLKEANAEIALINAGLTSRQDVCKAHGKDWHEVIAKLAEEKDIMGAAGISSETNVMEIEEEKDETA
jgi:lambda family phage portal protein